MWGERSRDDHSRAVRRAMRTVGAIKIGRAPTADRSIVWRLP